MPPPLPHDCLSISKCCMQVIRATVKETVDTIYSLGWHCEETAAVRGLQYLPRASILWQVGAGGAAHYWPCNSRGETLKHNNIIYKI